MEAPTYRFFCVWGRQRSRCSEHQAGVHLPHSRLKSVAAILRPLPLGGGRPFLDQRPLTLFNRLETRMNEALARVRRIKVGRVTSPPGAS